MAAPPPSSAQDRQHLGLQPACDVDRPPAIDEDVDLAPDTELLEIDPRLDREAGAAQDQALLVGLQVVHVGAIAVDFLADIVAGAVDEIAAIAGLVNHAATGGVDLP